MAETATAEPRHVVGYWCPKRPDGPLIPPHALSDPCGRDVAVYSDGTRDEVPPPPPPLDPTAVDPGWLHEITDNGRSDGPS